ncbi:Transglutaminase-like superfamily protein [Hathewaya proteolytica DSM 3090]|uniref:Transglutaminase-like superfamily protein n=1 Tax=Hathewaya proteolytica DSM 3090 TaxID=1121331 RepID=A0A1M6PGM0_9CLOT|nr:transglutaminase domain-containing protein [Hathewaya proteolytica]SHK07089.1 Transglutaminase-like superfamily protein [Hathewaya proteolytica DSM 3090]
MGLKIFYLNGISKNDKYITIKKITVLTVVCLCLFISGAEAITNDDEIYVKTYNAVTSSMNGGTQKSITLARKYVQEMSKNPRLNFAVGEFSKKIDVSQQKLFKKFYSYMYTYGGSEREIISQKEINEARSYLEDFATYQGNKIYISSWSCKLDEFQGKIVSKANESLEQYKKNPSADTFFEAKKWMEELSYSNNQDCKGEAARLRKLMCTYYGANDSSRLPQGMESILKKEMDEECNILGKDVLNTEELSIAIRGALRNFQHTLEVKAYNLKGSNVGNIIGDVLDKYPEIDFGYRGASYSIKDDKDGGQVITIKFKYAYESDVLLKQRDAVYNKVKDIISKNIYSYMTKFDVELFFHDYLVENTYYNEYYINQGINHPEDHNAFGVLIEGKGVCEGYAKAMCMLSKAVGLECIYVVGKANGPHGWNMVKLDDDKWYNLDITWNDPVSRNSEAKFMNISYKYFNISNEEFYKDHVATSNIPKADGEKYLRDNLNLNEKDLWGKEVKSISNEVELVDVIKDSIINRKSYVVGNFKNMTMTSKEIFERVKSVNKELKVSMSYSIIYDGTPMKYFKLSFEFK